MERYAVIDPNNKVVNVIIWDGLADWKPPEGHRVEKNNYVAIGDVWIPEMNDYVRPLKLFRYSQDDEAIAQRTKLYMEAKENLKSSLLFLKPDESVDMEL